MKCLQGQLAGGGQVQRPVVEAGALPVLAKDHIEFPMQPIFNLPVLANVAVKVVRRGREAAEVLPGLGRGLPVDFPARVDARNAAQMAPIGQSVEQLQLRFHRAAAALNAA